MNEPSLIEPTRIVKRDRPPEPLPIQSGDAINALIVRVLSDPNFPAERIAQILEAKIKWEELRERTEKNEARKAFVADMAEFKKNPPAIRKNKHVGFKSERTGNRTDYDHATHDEVTLNIIPALSAHGFSHRWVPTQPNGQVCVTCIITHKLGFSEELSITAPPDTSGNKSAVQAILSTKTLLERHTLLAATGLTTSDMPDADDVDKKDEKIPEVPADIWTALGDAASEGEAALRKMWAALSDTTRDVVFEHYPADWSALKDKAKATDRSRAAIDTATNMRRIMNLDIDEMMVAKQVEDENERLNRAGLLDPAWDVLNSEERRAWKGWLDWRKQHSRNGNRS